jgi:hypothetical protein
MQNLKTLVAEIKAVLSRGGSATARREADQQVAQKAGQGMRIAKEVLESNEADFGRHFEEWSGMRPEPRTPREDPHHKAMARKAQVALWFLLALKVVFWLVFGPSYFNVLPGLAVLIALCVSIPLSLGVKPLIAALILKPGLTPQQREHRLHLHVVAGIIAFGIAFGGLFLLRGLAGPLALIGALFVLPVLSICDLVLLYLMGIAEAYVHLYGWTVPFVRVHQDASAYLGEFEHYHKAAQNRLEAPAATLTTSTALGDKSSDVNVCTIGKVTTALLVLTIGLVCSGSAAHAQATMYPAGPAVPQDLLAELRLDSTTSVYASVAETINLALARSFYAWAEQEGVHRLRVATFERDGWLPRTIDEMKIEGIPESCAADQGERSLFRGISEAMQKQAQAACEHAKAGEADRIQAALMKAVAKAWHSAPLVEANKGRSCTAFYDALASIARVPGRNLIALVSDTEETCSKQANAVPRQAAGADVVVVLVPSKSDMGPGVSAASRFNAKKEHLQRIAPWLKVVLAPAELESYRLPLTNRSQGPLSKVSFWQR